jgi:MFS family permease
LTSLPTGSISLSERLAALALLAACFLLRLPYAFSYRFNSDEPQHLHVVWGWTHGLIQYRDVFDNHPPLFHLAMAPVLSLVGERAEALPLMRLALLPFWIAALLLTYLIGRKLYSDRIALWAVALLAVFSDFFFTSLAFRTDGPWAVAWLAALAVLVSGALTPPRVFAAGFLLGVAFGISQKTPLLAFALAGATLLALALVPQLRARVSARRLTTLAASWMAGMAVVPALLVGGFAAAGALRPMLYCVVTHNMVPGLGSWAHPWHVVILPLGLAAVLGLSAPAVRRGGGERLPALRSVLFLATALYVLCLYAAWPLITGQDWLPVHPLVAVLLVGAPASWLARHPRRLATRRLIIGAFAAVLVAGLATLVWKGPVWNTGAPPAIALVGDVLRLTDPADVVIDAKGETVFRRRAWYWVLESITRERLRRGMIADSLPRDLVAERCRVATLDDPRFPAPARAFLAANYVEVGRLRVAGTLLRSGASPTAPVAFRIAIPGQYLVVSASGPAKGRLDGTPLNGPRMLDAGRHEFARASGSGKLAVIWAKAVARGFTPFSPSGGAL